MSFPDRLEKAMIEVRLVKDQLEKTEKELDKLWWEYKETFGKILEELIEIRKCIDYLAKEKELEK